MHGRFGQWFPASITVVGIAGVVLLLFIVLAPVAERAVADPLARERVRNLMNRPDGDTLDAFALRHDKHYVFSADGRAAVAYRYVRGVGLMSGDPVGDPESFADAFRMFHDLCEGQGWRVAVLGARRDRLDVYETGRLRELYLGDEAIIDTAAFTLDGRHMRPVRQATNRTINHGITCEVYREGALDPTLRRALIGIADRHRGEQAERGFSMALDGLLEGRHPDALVTIARDPTGAPFAFQRYIPCKAGHALSLDAMRRDNVGVNGVNERMIVETITWAQRQRHRRGVAQLRGRARDPVRGRQAVGRRGRRSVGVAPAQPVLPDRVAAVVQREVPPALGAALPAVRLTHRDRSRRDRRAQRRGVSSAGQEPRRRARRLRRARRCGAQPEPTAGSQRDGRRVETTCAPTRGWRADAASGATKWRWPSRCTSPSGCRSAVPSTPTDTSSNHRTCGRRTSNRSTGIGPCASSATPTGSRRWRSAANRRS